jgi:hypothetical protein
MTAKTKMDPRIVQRTSNLRVVLVSDDPTKIVIEERRENAMRETSWTYVASYVDDRSLSDPEKAVLDLLVHGDRP